MKVPGLRPLRERSGLTQRDLAETAGVARRSIAGWESGENIRPNSASKVADALGVSVSDLCTEWCQRAIKLARSSRDEQPETAISETAIYSAPTPRDEGTEELLAMLRGYEEAARRREEFDFSAADLTRVSGYLATESIRNAAQAADKGDHAVVAELLDRASTVLDWLQALVTEREEEEARVRAEARDPMEVIAEVWSELNRARSGNTRDHAAQLTRAGIRTRQLRGNSES